LPHCSRPWYHICPTRTSHAIYVSHQHNIPYNLKGKPASTCIQPWHDYSNFRCCQLVQHQQSQTNSITNLLPMPKTANAFHMNSTSMTEFSSVVTLAIYIWVNCPSLLEVWLPINGTILIQQSPTSVEHVNVCQFLPFWTLQLRMWMSYLSHYYIMTHSHFDTWHHNKISKACWANKIDSWFKLQVRLTVKDFQFVTFFHKSLLLHMTTSEESLRLLFITHSLTIDLVHRLTCQEGHLSRFKKINSHYFSSLFYTTLLFNPFSPSDNNHTTLYTCECS
jgi:hypothetical protein